MVNQSSAGRFIFPEPERLGVPLDGEEGLFPVRRIYCVGRNYSAHIREMGGDEREPPFFFQKPSDSIVLDGQSIPYPSATSDFQHEIELVLAVGRSGIDIKTEDAAHYVLGCAVGIDLTRRDLQLQARGGGRPWEAGKSFDSSACIGRIRRTESSGIAASGSISLCVNGEVRQRGDISEMIWKAAEIVSHLSNLFRLERGDLIYTGTPAGVGKLEPGDTVDGVIEGIGSIAVSIEKAAN